MTFKPVFPLLPYLISHWDLLAAPLFLKLRLCWGPSISDIRITPIASALDSVYCRPSAYSCHVNILQCSFYHITLQFENRQWSTKAYGINFRQISLPKCFHWTHSKHFYHCLLIQLYLCCSPHPVLPSFSSLTCYFLKSMIFKLWTLKGGETGRNMGSVEGESWALFLQLCIGFLCKISLEEKGSNVKKHLKIYVALKFPIKTHLFPGVVLFFTKPLSSTLTFPSTFDTVLLGVMHLLTYCLALYF